MGKLQIKIIKSNRKSIALEIRPDMTVVVRAPCWMGDWQIHKFVEEKSDWISALCSPAVPTIQIQR